MKEGFELVEHIHKDASMAVYTLEKLLNNLQERDNKIKGFVEEILQKYEEYVKVSKEELEKNNIVPTEEGIIAKMMSSMGISKEVKEDNSDASIADMLIKGISMGSIEMEKKIKDYDKEVDKNHLKLAKDFLKFQEKTISELKKYL